MNTATAYEAVAVFVSLSGDDFLRKYAVTCAILTAAEPESPLLAGKLESESVPFSWYSAALLQYFLATGSQFGIRAA
jgi:hypothetical protein